MTEPLNKDDMRRMFNWFRELANKKREEAGRAVSAGWSRDFVEGVEAEAGELDDMARRVKGLEATAPDAPVPPFKGDIRVPPYLVIATINDLGVPVRYWVNYADGWSTRFDHAERFYDDLRAIAKRDLVTQTGNRVAVLRIPAHSVYAEEAR